MKITNLEQLKQEKKVKTYSCGSQKLSHEIRTKLDMVPIDIYKHRTTGKLINVFIMTDELSDFLKQWTANKPNKEKAEVHNGSK